jgi:hypothetical protein
VPGVRDGGRLLQQVVARAYPIAGPLRPRPFSKASTARVDDESSSATSCTAECAISVRRLRQSVSCS